MVIGLDSVETTVSGQFLDARTGELIEQPLTVTFQGPNADDVIDMFSKPMDRQEIDGGLASFGLRNSLNLSEESPARVTVVAESDGYIPTGRPVTVNSEGETTFIVYMIDPGNPPAGSAVRSERSGEAGSDGTVQQDVTVGSGTEQQSSARAAIQLSQGTVVRDADGGTLSGPLTTTLGYFNNSSGPSLRSFPGGVETPEGENLVTAGYTSIEIEESGGSEAATFSQPVQLTVDLPSGMTNPGTGQPIQAGDDIDIYSYDTDQAKWVHEGSATVQGPRANGNYFVEYPVDHLSYWSLIFPGVPTCTSGASITINRSGNTGPLQATLRAEGFSKHLTIPAGVSTISLPDDLKLGSVPALDATLTIRTETGESTQTGNLCSGSFNIVLAQAPDEASDVTGNVTLQCPNTDEYVRMTSIPTATVKYRRTDASEGTTWDTATDLQWDYQRRGAPPGWRQLFRAGRDGRGGLRFQDLLRRGYLYPGGHHGNGPGDLLYRSGQRGQLQLRFCSSRLAGLALRRPVL
ncbi:MAG: hypothetical protein U5K31_02795 [Balneolaceae bacterium]|nr:hypothetical protein [Balneolaceae bacterium]